MKTDRTIVVLSPGGGHAQRLLPLADGLVKRGLTVHVMTRAGMRDPFETIGAVFHDLDARYPLDAVDGESRPLPCRLVTFAAAYAAPLAAAVAALRPALLVYDSFAVVAPLVARRLGIPYVGMRAGHAQVPARAIAETSSDPRVSISAACRAAVETLRAEHAMPDATPFSYLDGFSPHLNLYPEPEAFLPDDARRAFEPLAFFGSLAPALREAASRSRPLAAAGRTRRVYVSFGGVVWTYYADAARAAMAAVADAAGRLDAEVLVSFGSHEVTASARRAIERPNVRVERVVDQWGALKDADLFVTHHGLNSTHEAIFHRVPMLSYPFLGDQPAMARCCQELGLAAALAEAPRAPLDSSQVRQRMEAVLDGRDRYAARLEEARRWEIETIQGRDAVIDRMLALA